jgi:hypothetical protein
MNLLIIVTVLILLLGGGGYYNGYYGPYNYSSYGPTGFLPIILVIVVIWLLMGRR